MSNYKKCHSSQKWDKVTDFIVVGMGAAGAVVMRMLSDTGFNVIGIEAGINADTDPLILDSTNSSLLEEDYTWKFFYNQMTAPNPDMNNRTLNYTTGRLLGGGTSINGMQYVRSTNDYWDGWANINGSEWGSTVAIAGYKDLENFVGVFGQYNPVYHGSNGLMKIRQAPIVESTMATNFATALATVANQSVISDYNDPTTPLGTFTRWSLFEQPNGDRASSSTDFLTPLINNPSKKHKIMLNTTVSKVIICKCGKTLGVKAIRNGKCIRIRACKEVILSVGIHSCEILQRSGIGPSSLLNSLNIPIIFPNNAVGSNSRNHLISTAIFSADSADFPGIGTDPQALYTGGAFLPDPTTGSDPTKRGFQWIGINPDPNIFVVVFYKLNPQSLGTDQIQNADPLRVSAVMENLLSDPTDLDSIVNVYQQQITALNSTLSNINPAYQLLTPSLSLIADTDALKEYIKNSLEHAHHWTGTCRMSPLNQNGVVNEKGEVHGVRQLRVADISVAPLQPNGNTAGPAFFVGYNIAKMIIAKYT